MTDPKLTASADPPADSPSTKIFRWPVANSHSLVLSPTRYVSPSPWRAPKRVSVSLWDAAAERPSMRRLAA